MKLYTEEIVRKAFNYGKTLEPYDSVDDFINSHLPIELPTDEEIQDVKLSGMTESEKLCFEFGGRWVVEHIKKQQKKTNTNGKND